MKKVPEFINFIYSFRLAFLIFLYCFQVQADENKSFKIGYITDFSGIGVFLSDNTRKGAELALSEVSSDPFFTENKLDLIFEDISGKLPNAVSAAFKLIKVDKVNALICDITGPCSAIAPKAFEAGIPLIYHSPATSIAESYSQSFRNFIDYTAACNKITQYWKNNQVLSIGELNANQEFSQRCSEGISQIYPEHYIYNYNPGDDLKPLVLEARKRNLNHLIFTGYENDFINLIKYSDSQRLANLRLGFIEIMLTSSLRKKLGDIPVSGIVAGFEEPSQNFKHNLERKFSSGKGLSDWEVSYPVAALSYNAVSILADSFKSCRGKNNGCLASYLKSPSRMRELNFRGFADKNPYKIVLKNIESNSLRAIDFP